MTFKINKLHATKYYIFYCLIYAFIYLDRLFLHLIERKSQPIRFEFYIIFTTKEILFLTLLTICTVFSILFAIMSCKKNIIINENQFLVKFNEDLVEFDIPIKDIKRVYMLNDNKHMLIIKENREEIKIPIYKYGKVNKEKIFNYLKLMKSIHNKNTVAK